MASGERATMTLQLRKTCLIGCFSVLLFLRCVGPNLALAQDKSEPHPPSNSSCHIGPADYKGWHAQQISNRWVQLIVVPQNGGRLMQVIFDGHAYLFVNPKLAGKYMQPSDNQ